MDETRASSRKPESAFLTQALEHMGPDLYRSNAYRVLDIGVDADRSARRKRVQLARQAVPVNVGVVERPRHTKASPQRQGAGAEQ